MSQQEVQVRNPSSLKANGMRRLCRGTHAECKCGKCHSTPTLGIFRACWAEAGSAADMEPALRPFKRFLRVII
jgi:hypothetical protein